MSDSSSPSPEQAGTSKATGFVNAAGWFSTAGLLVGLGYGAAYKLQIVPEQDASAQLRKEVVEFRNRLDKADADYKALSLVNANTRAEAAGLQASSGIKNESLGQCQTTLEHAQAKTEAMRREYSMASHLAQLRKQQASLEAQIKGNNGIFRASAATGVEKESLERDIGNLQKQIEAATKCN